LQTFREEFTLKAHRIDYVGLLISSGM